MWLTDVTQQKEFFGPVNNVLNLVRYQLTTVQESEGCQFQSPPLQGLVLQKLSKIPNLQNYCFQPLLLDLPYAIQQKVSSTISGIV